ncbi:MAG: hypothetical protein GY774_00360 [Planctomycetes bacterium]|nr:hypothetical protein [Planctomycetota bacterium]
MAKESALAQARKRIKELRIELKASKDLSDIELETLKAINKNLEEEANRRFEELSESKKRTAQHLETIDQLNTAANAADSLHSLEVATLQGIIDSYEESKRVTSSRLVLLQQLVSDAVNERTY